MPSLTEFLQEVDPNTDFDSLGEQEVSCEVGHWYKDNGEPAPWCAEKAEWRLIIRCRICGSARQVLACSPCKKLVVSTIRWIGPLLYFFKTKCGHRGRHKVATWVPFKG